MFALVFLGAIGVVLLAAALLITLVLLSDLRQLDVVIKRLVAERRVEDATRSTLRAMREAVRRDERPR